MTLIYQRKKRNAASLPASRILSLAIAPSGVVDATGFHTITHEGSSINTAVTKNGSASIRIPRNSRALANTTNNPLATLNIRTDSWNAAAWVRLVTLGTSHNILGNLTASNFYPLLYYYGKWYIGDGSTNFIALTTNPPLGDWIHVNSGFDVATNTLRLHINGTQVAKVGPGSGPMVNTTVSQGWEIGKRSPNGMDSDIYLGSLDVDRGYFRPEGSFVPE